MQWTDPYPARHVPLLPAGHDQAFSCWQLPFSSSIWCMPEMAVEKGSCQQEEGGARREQAGARDREGAAGAEGAHLK